MDAVLWVMHGTQTNYNTLYVHPPVLVIVVNMHLDREVFKQTLDMTSLDNSLGCAAHRFVVLVFASSCVTLPCFAVLPFCILLCIAWL